MRISIDHELGGKKYTLTFQSSDVPDDLSQQDVEPRVLRVMRREIQRFAEITEVALKDRAADAARLAVSRNITSGQAVVDATLGRGGPSFKVVSSEEVGKPVVLGSGTKDPEKGRMVGGVLGGTQ